MADPVAEAFGSIPVDASLKKNEKKDSRNKYKEFLDAIHASAFPKGNVDQQTRLEWENIVGEIMGMVLTQDLISGTMFSDIQHPFFRFRTVEEQMDQMVVKEFVELVNRKKYLIPSVTVMKENINNLVISLKGLGRQELIQMLQSFNISMQEQEHNDPLKAALGRRGL